MFTSHFSCYYSYPYYYSKNVLKSFLPVRPAEETGYPMKPGGGAEERSATPYRKSFSSWEKMKRVMCSLENMETVSGCRLLKVNLEATIYIYVNSTTQRCPKKIIKIFLIKDFFHLLPVSTTPVVHLELWISLRIFEKIGNALMFYSGAWGKLIHEKNQKSKILWHHPFDDNAQLWCKCDVWRIGKLSVLSFNSVVLSCFVIH